MEVGDKSKKNQEKSINCEEKQIKLYKNFEYYLEEKEEKEFLAVPIEDKDNIFAIRANDGSMEPIISKKDIILINKSIKVKNGEVGLFKVDKKIYLRKKTLNKDEEILLLSSNKNFFPVLVTSENKYEEIGKLVGVVNLH